MAFKVVRPGLQKIHFTDDDTYEFKPDGVLKVAKGDCLTYYAPGAWELVETENGHEPGTKRQAAKATMPRASRIR